MLRVILVSTTLLLASCVTMTPVKPAPHLQPVAIGDGSGSEATIVEADMTAEAPLSWADGNAIMIRPRVNGRDVGLFVLDTGATGMLISGEAARLAGLEAIGTTRVQNDHVTTVFRGETFEFGPLTLQGTKYAGINIPFGESIFGAAAVGIAGFDLFAGTVFEIDAAGGVARIHDPATYELPEGVEWQPLEIIFSLPHAVALFEGDYEGVFLLDTGYGDSVAFFDHVVEDYDLLEGRKTRGRWLLNFGGSTRVREGTLEWIELGGIRLDDVERWHFATGDVLAYPDPDRTSGILGMHVMRHFRLVLDYANRRVAFIPVEGP